MSARILQFPSPSTEPQFPSQRRLAERNRLVEEHMALVLPIANGIHRQRPPSFDLDDLVSIGNLALVKAADTYDASTNVPFEAWAKFKIRTSIVDATRRKAYRDSTHDEIQEWHSEMRDPRPNAEDALIASGRVQSIRECIEQLPERMRTVVIARYAEGHTLGRIPKAKQGYSARAVTDLHRGALRIVKGELVERGVAEAEPAFQIKTSAQIIAFVRDAA